jgi:hypothetical protein
VRTGLACEFGWRGALDRVGLLLGEIEQVMAMRQCRSLRKTASIRKFLDHALVDVLLGLVDLILRDDETVHVALKLTNSPLQADHVALKFTDAFDLDLEFFNHALLQGHEEQQHNRHEQPHAFEYPHENLLVRYRVTCLPHTAPYTRASRKLFCAAMGQKMQRIRMGLGVGRRMSGRTFGLKS